MGGVLIHFQIIVTALFGSAGGAPRTQPPPPHRIREFYCLCYIGGVASWAAHSLPSKTTPGLPAVALIRGTSAAVWFKPPSTWITQVILNAKVNPLLSHSPPLLVTHCTLCLSCRHIHPSDEGRSVLLVIHPRLSAYRHLLIAGRRSSYIQIQVLVN
jgi:hypothetical protein